MLYIDNVNNDIYNDTDYDSNDIDTNYDAYRQKYDSICPFGNEYQMSQTVTKCRMLCLYGMLLPFGSRYQ